MNCQICGNKASLSFIKDNYRILKCTNCNYYFTDLIITPEEVKEIYSDRYFYGGQDGYPDYTLEREILIKRGEYYARKIRKYISQGSLLDVGSAAGFILKGFLNKGWRGIGLEPNAKMVEFGKNNLGIDIYCGTIESVKFDKKFDLILMIQVIAHLHDLNQSLRNVYDLLIDGGYVLIETWNRNSLIARIFGSRWHEYSPPTTLNYFDKKTLNILMQKYRFKKIASGKPSKKILSAHAKSLLVYKIRGDKFLSRFFLKIVNFIPDNIKIPYPAGDLFWTLYRVNK